MSFSQAGYPKTILYNSDTVIGINSNQLRVINGALVERDKYKVVNDSLNSQIDLYDNTIDDYKNMAAIYEDQQFNQHKQLNIYKKMVDDLNQVIHQKDKQIRKNRLVKILTSCSLIILCVLV